MFDINLNDYKNAIDYTYKAYQQCKELNCLDKMVVPGHVEPVFALKFRDLEQGFKIYLVMKDETTYESDFINREYDICVFNAISQIILTALTDEGFYQDVKFM